MNEQTGKSSGLLPSTARHFHIKVVIPEIPKSNKHAWKKFLSIDIQHSYYCQCTVMAPGGDGGQASPATSMKIYVFYTADLYHACHFECYVPFDDNHIISPTKIFWSHPCQCTTESFHMSIIPVYSCLISYYEGVIYTGCLHMLDTTTCMSTQISYTSDRNKINYYGNIDTP